MDLTQLIYCYGTDSQRYCAARLACEALYDYNEKSAEPLNVRKHFSLLLVRHYR